MRGGDGVGGAGTYFFLARAQLVLVAPGQTLGRAAAEERGADGLAAVKQVEIDQRLDVLLLRQEPGRIRAALSDEVVDEHPLQAYFAPVRVLAAAQAGRLVEGLQVLQASSAVLVHARLFALEVLEFAVEVLGAGEDLVYSV